MALSDAKFGKPTGLPSPPWPEKDEALRRLARWQKYELACALAWGPRAIAVYLRQFPQSSPAVVQAIAAALEETPRHRQGRRTRLQRLRLAVVAMAERAKDAAAPDKVIIGRVAKRYKLSDGAVKLALKEHGVSVRRGGKGKK
jgi:hypothetical protein